MAVEYEVQWRRGNQGWNVNNRQAETTATMYTITNLSPGTYQVRIRAVRDGVPGLWSIPLSADVTTGVILVATVRADDASIDKRRNSGMDDYIHPCAAKRNRRECNGVCNGECSAAGQPRRGRGIGRHRRYCCLLGGDGIW